MKTKECYLKSIVLRPGDQLKIQGKVASDAERIRIDLGADEDNLALHFNPRWDDAAIVCNSKHESTWGEEERHDNPLQRGATLKILIKLTGNLFEVELPNGEELTFPNREGMEVINYIRVKGDFKITSFKLI
ncbi:galectin-2-like [Engraulis encrasicolus]|uniref:galectin-2-like n=1 Tax=Engraulis encrasicolus TaxID=184585 RepID=UPI002FD68C64